MRALYGLGNHSIFHVQRTLKAHSKELRLQTLGLSASVKPNAEVILVPTVSNFIRKRKDLLASDAIVIVFDTPVLMATLQPLEILDAKKLGPLRYSFTTLSKETLIAKIQTTGNVDVVKNEVDVISRLLDSTAPSIMKPILSFLYSIPNAEKRIDYRFQLLRYLTNPKLSRKDLRKSLIALSRQKGSSSSVDDLLEFFATDQVINTRTVLGLIRKAKKSGKAPKVDRLCEQQKVSAFDVKYIQKAYASDKKHVVVCEEERSTERTKKSRS